MAGGQSGKALRMLGMVVLVAGLAACSQKKQNDTAALDGLTAEQLYKRGELALQVQAGKNEDALADFEEVERLYPYSEWAKRALIMQAFTQHKNRKYEEARVAAQRYLDFYPGDEDAAYAHYLLALSYYDQIDEVGRDQGLTYQALQALRVVIEEYPDSEYAKSAILKFDLAFDHLAAKEMEIGRYYLKRGNYTAAINRFRSVVQDFQTTTQTAEALERLVEAYLALGLTDEAQTAGAILGLQLSILAVLSGRLQPAEKAGSVARSQGHQLAVADLSPDDQGRMAVITLRCGAGGASLCKG